MCNDQQANKETHLQVLFSCLLMQNLCSFFLLTFICPSTIEINCGWKLPSTLPNLIVSLKFIREAISIYNVLQRVQFNSPQISAKINTVYPVFLVCCQTITDISLKIQHIRLCHILNVVYLCETGCWTYCCHWC